MQQNFCWLDCRIRYKPFKKKMHPQHLPIHQKPSKL